MATSVPSMAKSVSVGEDNSIRFHQISALKRMINLNVVESKSTVPSEPVWKILVYDKFGQDIISPLLTVKDLRNLGVTLHLAIDSNREPVPDAVAVYFVVPSKHAMSRIYQDCQQHLYHSMYFNFISPIGRPMLEDLAKAAVDGNCSSQITKMISSSYDIRTGKIYRIMISPALNRPDAKDTDIMGITNTIVESLFSVFVTAGVVPIIRSPQGNAAEMVAESLDRKLRDNLRDTRNNMIAGEHIPFGQMSFSRPLLIILDRNMDLSTTLHHSWTYQALVHDVFELELNRITITPSGDCSQRDVTDNQLKSYDMQSSDKFWADFRGSPFPSVADAVQTEVNAYRAREEEITRLRDVMGVSEENTEIYSDNLSESTAKLTSAISSLPELMERKNRIDMHTTIATALLEEIKARKLDLFFEMEDKLISKSSMDKSVKDILCDPSAGTMQDKLRLFLIYYILSAEISEQEMSQALTALESAGADMAAVEYIKKWKAFSKMSTNPRAPKLGSAGSMSTMFTQMVTSGSKYVMEGVKNLVIRTKDLPITRIVDQLFDLKSSKETDDYLYFDPKSPKGESFTSLKNKGQFQEAYVFVVGGGNYIEYQNLRDYCRRQQMPRKVTYGTTELMNASEFLQQLSKLGSSSL